MTDRDIIERVAVMFGSRVGTKSQRREAWKPLFYVNVVSARAVAWMERLLPYMGERRTNKIKDLLAQFSYPQSSAWKSADST